MATDKTELHVTIMQLISYILKGGKWLWPAIAISMATFSACSRFTCSLQEKGEWFAGKQRKEESNREARRKESGCGKVEKGGE
jgi:hypothetical protein